MSVYWSFHACVVYFKGLVESGCDGTIPGQVVSCRGGTLVAGYAISSEVYVSDNS